MPAIPALGRLWQGDHEFEASLSYIVRLCLKKQNRTKLQTSGINGKNAVYLNT
jgi:hypothetical protein